MSIDWITAAAQIGNFLVLVWLLKRFLYRPILDGIDAREAAISRRMGEAAQSRQQAEAAEALFHERLAGLRAGESATIESARVKAEAERDALLSRAQEALRRDREAQDEQRAREAREYTAELHRTGASALLSLTRKALQDLADETLEERIAAHVVGRLAPMAGQLLAAAADHEAAVATTRDPLPQQARDRLTAELQTMMPERSVRFETDPAQSPGLILRMGGAQVAWTVDTYIDSLDTLLEDAGSRGRETG